VILLSFVAVLMLLYRNRQKILEELGEFVTSKAALTAAIFLGVLSVAFIAEANNFFVLITLIVLIALAVAIIVFFVFFKTKKQKLQPKGASSV
jgi:amino acid transporter